MTLARESVQSRRRGTTLVELLVGIIVASIVAGGLLRMVVVDLHFADDREAWRTARQAARGGLAVLSSDLRMIENSEGVEAAASSGQDLTLKVPYAFGALCATNGTLSTVSLIPVDSTMFVQPGHAGFAWRDESTGAYSYTAGGAVTGGASPGTCTSAGIVVLPGSRVVTVSGSVPPILYPGTIVFLYRRIRYELKASSLMPGQTALWRTPVGTGLGEEISAPFVPESRFRFFTAASSTAQSVVPSPLSTIVGLELAFGGRSDRTPRGEAGPKTVPFTTSIYFHNRNP
jgi:type II secretory pathway pseudopilin PulG